MRYKIFLFCFMTTLCLCKSSVAGSLLGQRQSFGTFCCGEWFLFADYLYWQPRSEAWPYVESFTTTVDQETTHRIDPDYHSGARIGFGYAFKSCNPWVIDAAWTHLVARDTSDTPLTPDINLFPVWVGPFLDNVLTADANNNLTINFADVNIGCPRRLGKHFFVHPHVGFRGLWVQNKLNVDYSLDLTGIGFSAPVTSRNKINFQGYGGRAGVDVKWNFWHALSLIERSGISLLRSSISIDQRTDPISHTSLDIRVGVFDTIRLVTPTFDVFIGLSFEEYCNWNWISRVMAHVGWEENFLLNVLPFKAYSSSFNANNFSSRTIKGDLTLGGLTAGCVICF